MVYFGGFWLVDLQYLITALAMLGICCVVRFVVFYSCLFIILYSWPDLQYLSTALAMLGKLFYCSFCCCYSCLFIILSLTRPPVPDHGPSDAGETVRYSGLRHDLRPVRRALPHRHQERRHGLQLFLGPRGRNDLPFYCRHGELNWYSNIIPVFTSSFILWSRIVIHDRLGVDYKMCVCEDILEKGCFSRYD